MHRDNGNENSPPSESRSTVIKMMQEQIQDLLFYRNEYENIESRLKIAENALIVQEEQYKLKIDELTSELESVKEQNALLIDQTMRFKAQQIGESQKVLKDTDVKIKIYKEKYDDLLKNSSVDAIARQKAKTEQLRQKNKEVVDKLSADLKNAQAQIKQNENQLGELKTSNKDLKNTIIQLNKQITELKDKNQSLQKDVNTLSLDHKRKTDLLVQQRSKLQIDALKKKQNDAKASQIMDKNKKALMFKDGQIAKLSTALENESKLKKKQELRNEKLKKSTADTISKLQTTISNLKEENEALRQSKQESEESESSMEVELVFLRNQKKQLEEKLDAAQKLHQKNVKLQQVVGQLKNAVENLETSASSYESEAQTKESDLRAIIQKHFEGVDDTTEWVVLIAMADKALDETEALKIHCQKLEKKLEKSKQKRMKLSEDLYQSQANLNDVQREVDEVKSQMALRIAGSKRTIYSSANSRNQGGSSLDNASPRSPAGSNNGDFNSALAVMNPAVSSAEAHAMMMDLSEINSFRGVISQKIDVSNFKARNAILQANAKLNGQEWYPVNARTITLVSVFAIRFLHFKRIAQFNPSTILSFVTPCGRKYTSIEETLLQNVNKVMEDNNSMHGKEEESAEFINNSAEQITTLKSQVDQYESQIKDERRQKEELQKSLDKLKAELSKKVDSALYEETQKQLRETTQHEKDLSEELTSVKGELQRLLDAVKINKTNETNITAQLDESLRVNEELKGQIEKLQQELQVLYVANKEKSRDILALERKNNSKISKISLELPDVSSSQTGEELQKPTKRRSKSVSFTAQKQQQNPSFFLNENIRDGLAQMQNAILKHD
ncbi:hypothetical protein TVAG_355140 [Trichomonas vaginalis G3]|uniref:Uncharacterized protein n=1 Tax=Trichomonas vaginalis (strain ATCC PRA-98 / G3) TaxID=412133 RepID=A2EFZ9_TRIV3|nr:A-type inclusion protein-related family [Trichomonas vaginalis G3]EAY08455.1 hypothetical protein TVAG_355140 [Trichomonas vaginalis G3]KAI5518113.1 A-type inclusion protein-related family [Trichomonas vaginalis G3]|eukprot:XP_001320678.1 hypothetical protein [Trichomonas vaginalis G3]